MVPTAVGCTAWLLRQSQLLAAVVARRRLLAAVMARRRELTAMRARRRFLLAALLRSAIPIAGRRAVLVPRVRFDSFGDRQGVPQWRRR